MVDVLIELDLGRNIVLDLKSSVWKSEVKPIKDELKI